MPNTSKPSPGDVRETAELLAEARRHARETGDALRRALAAGDLARAKADAALRRALAAADRAKADLAKACRLGPHLARPLIFAAGDRLDRAAENIDAYARARAASAEAVEAADTSRLHAVADAYAAAAARDRTLGPALHRAERMR